MQKFASVRIISPENKANDETKSEGLNKEKRKKNRLTLTDFKGNTITLTQTYTFKLVKGTSHFCI